MDPTECLKLLSDQFGREEWFHSTGLDQYGRLVVYVKYMNHATLNDVPDRVGGKQVMVHFAGALTATREQFTSNPNAPGSTLKAHVPDPPIEAFIKAAQALEALESSEEEDVAGSEEEEKSILYLQRELDKLEKACGSYTLQDIFYEIQDQKNAVTDASSRYPEVRKSLERLYGLYGFDIIYEELDG
jgi:hypothetical protein